MKAKFQARLFGLFLTVAFTICSPVAIVASMQTGEARDTTKSLAVNFPKAEQSVTQHKITVVSASIPYTATAGTLIVRNEKDIPYASMGFTAYRNNRGKTYSTQPRMGLNKITKGAAHRRDTRIW